MQNKIVFNHSTNRQSRNSVMDFFKKRQKIAAIKIKKRWLKLEV